MDGYSKIKIMDSQNSRSTDFSDLLSFAPTPNPKSTTNPTSKIPETNLQIKNTTTTTHLDHSYSQDEEEGRFGGGGGGLELKRNRSVSSSSSAASGFQSAVKGAILSMRRSSSTVSERYCRIHNQSAALTSPIDDEEANWETTTTTTTTTRSVKKKQKGGKIFKACKRIFGL